MIFKFVLYSTNSKINSLPNMVADFFVDRENMNDYKYMCVYKNIHKYVFLNIKNSFFFHCVCVCV